MLALAERSDLLIHHGGHGSCHLASFGGPSGAAELITALAVRADET